MAKHSKIEEIVAKLRQADVLILQGQSISDAIRSIGVSSVPYYRWRREFGSLKSDQVLRMKDLEISVRTHNGGAEGWGVIHGSCGGPIDHFWLTDEQFARIAPLLPNDTRGKERVDDRRVISGIVQVLKSGGRWTDAQHDLYGPKKTLYNRFVRWAAAKEGLGRAVRDAGPS